MASEFEAQLGPCSGCTAATLPLAHTTTFETSVAVLTAGEFKAPQACPVYGEHLLYTFVARPAYRFGESPDTRVGVAFAPVCFLLKAECTASAVRALPFDSGAFGRYKHQMHPTWELADFEMSDAAKRATQVLERFWETKRDYYEARPVANVSIPATKTLLQQYHTLLTNGVGHGFDTRCSTIEVQLASPKSTSDDLVAVFVPDRAADDPDYRLLVRNVGANLIPYRFHEPFYANDFATSIYDAVLDFLNDEGVI